MNGFVLLSAGIFICFTYQIIDDGLCDATQLPGLHRDPNKQLRYAQFIEHFYHVLDVPKIEGVEVQTGRHCLLRCVKNDRCFPRTLEHFIYQTEISRVIYYQLTSTMHPRSSKRIILSITTALW